MPTLNSYCPARNGLFDGDQKLYEKYAAKELAFSEKLGNMTNTTLPDGNVPSIYYCACYKENPWYTISDFALGDPKALCYDWKVYMHLVTGAKYVVALLIVLFNQLAYYICLWTVNFIGLHYQT